MPYSAINYRSFFSFFRDAGVWPASFLAFQGSHATVLGPGFPFGVFLFFVTPVLGRRPSWPSRARMSRFLGPGLRSVFSCFSLHPCLAGVLLGLPGFAYHGFGGGVVARFFRFFVTLAFGRRPSWPSRVRMPRFLGPNLRSVFSCFSSHSCLAGVLLGIPGFAYHGFGSAVYVRFFFFLRVRISWFWG